MSRTQQPEPMPEPMSVALRCYADTGNFALRLGSRLNSSPSRWTVVFDTETGVDAAQQIRFGAYQIREGDRLHEAGIFYDDGNLTPDETHLLHSIAVELGLKVRSTFEFIEDLLFKYGYDREGTIVGFNVPFDISRIAIRHESARRSMKGGFTFIMSEYPWRPRIQIKHLNSRAALMRFTIPGKQRCGRGMRRRNFPVAPHRGYFVDVKTLAAALTSSSHSLSSLANFLGTAHRKLETEDHGGPLTEEYVRYAGQDVQVTWECYRELLTRYESHRLTDTPVHTIKSEASIGKAYLKRMGILPWRQLQPDFLPHLLGLIMSTYYGGRSEVHIRRQAVQSLYCDFLSMYPTVCTLMRLWRFVIGGGLSWHDSTNETVEFLRTVTLRDLKAPMIWTRLNVLVQVLPQGDALPVRARYGHEPQHTIGLNYLTSGNPLWFTLADCIASKLLTGRVPHVIRAITFDPKGPQSGLQSVCIAGQSEYHVHPESGDFYRTLIDLRTEVRAQAADAEKSGLIEDVSQLVSLQLALKILANATSYGIFMEVNVEELGEKDTVHCLGADGRPFAVQTANLENLGTYFHPLLATLITGAARLMLAITERLAGDAGIDWAFCDTDSMALARPDSMPADRFVKRAQKVRRWFDALNPYTAQGELLKLEHANFAPDGSGCLEPLYCFAVSAKRYALFNLDADGRPVIRKASAHGLGHLMAPYTEATAPPGILKPSVTLGEIGVERWQYDLWYQIISAALSGHPDGPDLDYHSALNQPAISRYAATTPGLLRWFDTYNQNRPYIRQVRPFGFMAALHATKL
jgi:hypothetical protein